MRKLVGMLVAWVVVGCGGVAEETVGESPPVETCSDPIDTTNANIVTESGYEGSGAGQTRSYALVGSYSVDLWKVALSECRYYVDGCEVESIETGDVIEDSIVTVAGCSFAVTFYSSL